MKTSKEKGPGSHFHSVEETLGRPPLLTRGTLYGLAVLLVVAGAWASRAKIDLTLSARGSVRPRGNLVKIQTIKRGRLLEVHAEVGDRVEEGQPLFRIDPTDTELAILAAEASSRRIAFQLESLSQAKTSLLLQQEREREREEIEREQARRELDIETAKLAQVQAAGRARKAQSDNAREQYELAERGREFFPRNEVRQRKTDWIVADADLDQAVADEEVARQQIEVARDLLQLRGKQADVAEESRKRERASLEDRLSSLEQEQARWLSEHKRLLAELQELTLRAPTSGIVTAVENRSGEVVETRETLATLSPEDAPWLIVAYVSHDDAGDLRERIGAPVQIAFDAFPTRRFGTSQGRLLSVSPDIREHPQLGTAYAIEVGLRDRSLEGRGGQPERALSLGMTATVEILKEETSLLSLFLREIRDRTSLSDARGPGADAAGGSLTS